MDLVSWFYNLESSIRVLPFDSIGPRHSDLEFMIYLFLKVQEKVSSDIISINTEQVNIVFLLSLKKCCIFCASEPQQGGRFSTKSKHLDSIRGFTF